MLTEFGFRRLLVICQLLVVFLSFLILPAFSEKVKTTISTKECDYEVEKCKAHIAPSDAFCRDLVNSEHDCDPNINWEPPAGDGNNDGEKAKIIGDPFVFPGLPGLNKAFSKSTETPKSSTESTDEESKTSTDMPKTITESPTSSTNKMMADIFAKIFVVGTTTESSLDNLEKVIKGETGEPVVSSSSSPGDANGQATTESVVESEQPQPTTISSVMSTGDEQLVESSSKSPQEDSEDTTEQEQKTTEGNSDDASEGPRDSPEVSTMSSVLTTIVDSTTEQADELTTVSPTTPEPKEKTSKKKDDNNNIDPKKSARKNVEELESIKSKLGSEFGAFGSFFSKKRTTEDPSENTRKSHGKRRKHKPRRGSSSESSEEKPSDQREESTSCKSTQTESSIKTDVKAPDIFSSNFEALFDPKAKTQKPKGESYSKKSESKQDERQSSKKASSTEKPSEDNNKPLKKPSSVEDREIVPPRTTTSEERGNKVQPSMIIRKKTAPTNIEPPSKIYERKVDSITNKLRSNPPEIRSSSKVVDVGQDRGKNFRSLKEELKSEFGGFGGRGGGGSRKSSLSADERLPIPLGGVKERMKELPRSMGGRQDVKEYPSILNDDNPVDKEEGRGASNNNNDKFSNDDFEEIESIEDIGDDDDDDDNDELGGFLSGVL